MRLWLTLSLRLLRGRRSIPCAKHALAERAKSDANRRLLSFNAPWLPPGVQQKRSNAGSNGIAPVCAVGGHLLLKSSCNPTLEILRTYRDGDRGPRPPGGEKRVTVSLEVWRLLQEYDVPATITRVFNVHIHVTRTSSKDVQLTLRGPNADQVKAMLVTYLRGILELNSREFSRSAAEKRYGTLVKLSKDIKSVLLVGPSEATIAAKGIIDECDCIEEFDIDNFVGFYLINNNALHQNRLSAETDALISPVPGGDAPKWKAVVVGPAESVKRLRSKLDGLHVKRLQKPRAVCCWLTSPGKGVKDARSLVLDRKFNTYIHTGQLTDSDPARMEDLVLVGDDEENVDIILATIDSIVVEKVNMTELQLEFWMGHDEEQNRNRPKHKLEDVTDTCIVCDRGASCFHVSGRPDNVREAVKEIKKTQHIALRTSVVSFAMASYVGRTRPAYENGDRQIHLAYNDTRPGTWELRRLYVVARQGDDAEAGKADDDLMRKLDLDEIVLDVPEWARFLVRQCREIGESTVTGIGFSEDAIKGRVLIDIAGSKKTIKQGMKEVIRRIESHASYKEGDICLRRIEGECVDTDGFKRTGAAMPLDVSCCKEPFLWERLTRERWRYAGGPRGGRAPKRPRQPSA